MKLKISSSTWFIPYDSELYFINLEEDIDDNLINVSKDDVNSFFNKKDFNWDHTNYWKSDKHCIFSIDNQKDVLIMEFILKEIDYGIDRDWYDFVTCWREHEEQEYKHILQKGKKEHKRIVSELKLFKKGG
jgi:hypothetical protein